jgi:predicted aldo/keto reductase-like oxidoreductase
MNAPVIFIVALQRYDFDSLLFPLNFIQYADPDYRRNSEELLQLCRSRDVGIMVIKSITMGPWGEKRKTYNTWYQPFTEIEHIQIAVNFALSQDITGICTAGDTRLLPDVLRACENYTPMTQPEQEALIERGRVYEPLFV